ncbi:MAG: hypothetical protein ABI852_10965 [Gemmatimonadaceae bacterium]
MNRKAFVLPVVLITTILVAVLAASLQAAVWRATRHARLGFAGERALHAGDAAISAQLTAWDARAFAGMPVGTRITTSPTLPNGLSASVTLARTSFDGALIEATGTSTQNGVPLNTQRRVTRVLALRNPPLDLASPLTLLGSASFAAPNAVSSLDETPVGWNTECAGSDSIDAPNINITDTTARRVRFDGAWNQWVARASRSEFASSVTAVAPIVTGALCGPGAGDPLRGFASIAPCTNEWGARAELNATPLLLSNASRHQGVLMIDGDLNLTGDLEVRGLLMVRGAIDASVGRLTVIGAALVRDDMGHGSRFGIATRVRYSRCALRRALSATGAPAAITTRGWLERF